jgi:hypothetical protein
MATDGVKIIDGDLAHDTYNQIMDLYDGDASIELIRKEVPFTKQDYGREPDFYHEIFVTAYALAFWEIGELTNDILEEVKRVIDLKAGVKTWAEQCDEKEGRKRQRELDKLLKKISQPNLKIRKRKKYKKIVNFFFQPEDLLSFKLDDGSYYAVICAKVEQYRGECCYYLAATTYKGKSRPTAEDLKTCFIIGTKIGSGYGQEDMLLMQPGIDHIWKYTGVPNIFFGLSLLVVLHEDFMAFKERFEVVGKLKIRESFKHMGSRCGLRGFDRFQDYFGDLEKNLITFREEKYPVSLLCEL